ncbi:hypothetical protein FRC17_002147, partial [Serendipita sp. 399]
MSLSGKSQELKDAGNTEFRKGNFKKALELYSKACNLVPNNAVLWANSAACSLHLKRYADAEAQARKAIAADSSYAKGFGRLGAALSSLNKYEDAIEAYKQAIPLLSASEADRKLQSQYDDAILELTTHATRAREDDAKKEKHPHAGSDYDRVKFGGTEFSRMNSAGGQFPWDAAKRYITTKLIPDLQAGKKEGWDSSAWLLLAANQTWIEGIEVMKKNVRRGVSQFGVTGAIFKFSEAIMMNDRVLRFEERDFLLQYSDQVEFEALITNALFSPEDDLEKIKRDLPSLVATKGWEHLRPALAITVRGWFTNAMFLQIHGDKLMDKRLYLLRWAADLTDWLPKQYPDAYKSTHPTPETLDEIRVIGERLVKICQKYPVAEPDSSGRPDNQILWAHYHGFQMKQLADGYSLQAFYHMKTAAKAGIRQADGNEARTHGSKAAEFYVKAATTLPRDDEGTA